MFCEIGEGCSIEPPHFMRIGQEGLINHYDDFEDYLLDCLQNAINNN